MSTKYVLSSSAFEKKVNAEDKINKWWKEGSLKHSTKMYEVVEVYEMRLKFVKKKA